jgi:hypothetical protein
LKDTKRAPRTDASSRVRRDEPTPPTPQRASERVLSDDEAPDLLERCRRQIERIDEKLRQLRELYAPVGHSAPKPQATTHCRDCSLPPGIIGALHVSPTFRPAMPKSVILRELEPWKRAHADEMRTLDSETKTIAAGLDQFQRAWQSKDDPTPFADWVDSLCAKHPDGTLITHAEMIPGDGRHDRVAPKRELFLRRMIESPNQKVTPVARLLGLHPEYAREIWREYRDVVAKVVKV